VPNPEARREAWPLCSSRPSRLLLGSFRSVQIKKACGTLTEVYDTNLPSKSGYGVVPNNSQGGKDQGCSKLLGNAMLFSTRNGVVASSEAQVSLYLIRCWASIGVMATITRADVLLCSSDRRYLRPLTAR